VSPKVSALYHITPAFDAYAAINGGFRSPDGVIVDPTLPTTKENATEVGVRYASRRFSGTLALFLVNQSNLVTVDPITLTPNDGGTTRQEGAELEGSARLNNSLTLFAHAIVNHARFVHLITDAGDTLTGKPIPQVSNATVEGGIDFQRGLVVGSVWAAYTGPWTPVGMQGTLTAAYTLVNFRATIPLPGVWSAVVGVQNIFSVKYMEVAASGYVSPGQPVTAMLTVRHNY
jgi:outer membrane receptor protein involved in Fe transport